MLEQQPHFKRMVCICESVTEAEIRYVVRNEFARTVGDVGRRTRLGQGLCGGMRCASRCGSIVADELDLSPHEAKTQVVDFLRTMSRRRLVALGPDQARQEALIWQNLRSQGGLFDRT